MIARVRHVGTSRAVHRDAGERIEPRGGARAFEVPRGDGRAAASERADRGLGDCRA